MKSKYAYLFVAAAVVFAAAMGYLRYRESEGGPSGIPASSSRGTVRPGKVVIAYAGDLMGSLDPCG
jgi:hypothetical protein